MRKKIDLTGQRFGRLVVVREIVANKKTSGFLWECKCDCGNIKNKRTQDLRTGNTRSCGCYKKDFMKLNKKIDLTGNRFGRLKVLCDTGKRTDKQSVVWSCSCDCGNKVNVKSSSLISGNTQSCGCYSKDILSERTSRNHKEMIEKKYGNSLVEKTSLSHMVSKMPSNNTSGVKGVDFRRKEKMWRARIKFQGVDIYLGLYKNKQDAIKARKEAEEKYFQPILEKYGKESN